MTGIDSDVSPLSLFCFFVLETDRFFFFFFVFLWCPYGDAMPVR